jgi:transcriptional regulator with XRE-family HTH domain
MSDSFGVRLRAERERRQLSLSAIATQTKINIHLLEGLERDDLSRWPAGIFRRSFLRVYADALGLDSAPLLREFLVRFPDPGDPQHERQALRDSYPVESSPLRLTLAGDGSPVARGVRWLRAPTRWAAAACDLGVVLGVATGLFAVSGTFWLSLALCSMAYYGIGIIVLGNTPGMDLLGPDRQRNRAPLAFAAAPPPSQKEARPEAPTNDVPAESLVTIAAGHGNASAVRARLLQPKPGAPRRLNEKYRPLAVNRRSVCPVKNGKPIVDRRQSHRRPLVEGHPSDVT